MNMGYTELKIRLMQLGAVFTSRARSKMCQGSCGQIYFSDYPTTSGVVLKIDHKMYVNVPVKMEGTPFRIDDEEGRLVMKVRDICLPLQIEIMKEPEYALTGKRLDDKIPVRELVMTHADRLRISPIFGCSHHCRFCTCCLAGYREIPLHNLDRAVQIALKDPNNTPRHVLISGGTPRMGQSNYAYMNEVYRFFPNKYKELKFDVMLSPRGKDAVMKPTESEYEEFLLFLKEECKVATMSVNLELYNEEKRKNYIYGKWKIGKDRYFKFIKKAVRIFGGKNIRSSLVVGLESEKDTLEGVRALADCGCVPVLSAFVPAAETGNMKKPEPKFLLDVVHKASKIAEQKEMKLGPVLYRACTHNSLTEEEGSISIPDEIYREILRYKE